MMVSAGNLEWRATVVTCSAQPWEQGMITTVSWQNGPGISADLRNANRLYVSETYIQPYKGEQSCNVDFVWNERLQLCTLFSIYVTAMETMG